MKRDGNKWRSRLIFYCVILLLWQGSVSLGFWPQTVLPSPGQVFESFLKGIKDRSFLFAIAISMRRILIGYGFSVVGGILLGTLLVYRRYIDDTIGSLAIGLQALPSICWLPIGLLWFGPTETSIILVIVLGSLFSLAISTREAIRAIPPLYVRAARTMGAHRWNLYKDIMVPAALPGIVTGLKQSWTFSWRALMAGELLFVSLGLGYLLDQGRKANDPARIYSVMIVIVCISLAVDSWIFGRIEKRVRMRWGLTYS